MKIKDASYPAPFARGLEFNSPAHGPWNIVHTGMLLPEARQIYVCAENCMRGVVLTAAEMNAADRFSSVILDEKDFLKGNLEELTIEGVTDILNRLKKKPRAVLLFTVCVHHFLGCDLKWIYKNLEKRFPDIIFIRCYMDPIMQKQGLSPDQKLRKAIYEPLKDQKENVDADAVTLLGSDFALDESSDIRRFLEQNGYKLRELPVCKSWEEYQKLGRGKLFLSCYPPAKYGAEYNAKQMGRQHLYLPASFDYEEISAELRKLGEALSEISKTGQDTKLCSGMAGNADSCNVDASKTFQNKKNGITDHAKDDSGKAGMDCQPDVKPLDISQEISSCEAALAHAKHLIGDTSIAIDYTFHPRPLGLARLLLVHGFRVKTVYLDSITPEEEPAFCWLKEHNPEMDLEPTIQTKMRFIHRETEEKTLAIGQKAAWFTGTLYFVNMVQGGGLWGFDGIRRTAELMEEAFLEEKDPQDLIVRKGWGCESCI